MPKYFPYRVNGAVAALLMPLGFKREKDGVTVGDGRFSASLGFLRITTQLTNVTGAHITRDYRWWTAIGPRRSFADEGLTFGTNQHAGVCIHFAKKVPSPLGPRGHSAITVTVDDLDGLVRELGYAE
jgi:hypothetical protein